MYTPNTPLQPGSRMSARPPGYFDRSRPVADHSNRNFWIIEERFKGEKHEPFELLSVDVE